MERIGEVYHIEGSVGESSPLFTVDLPNDEIVLIDLGKMTILSSIGIKNWISWMSMRPENCRLKFYNCPIVILDQASTVLGFLPRATSIESFKAPYLCDNCGAERLLDIKRGAEYEYTTTTAPMKIELPKSILCHKCRNSMEIDFIPERYLIFLKEPRI